MGITPISNLLPSSFSAPSASALEPLPMARVENSGRAGDDAYSPSNGKSARGSEDDTEESDEEEVEEEWDPTGDAEPREILFDGPPADARPDRAHASGTHPVSFFA
jgi:hypothetical protein